MPPCKKATKGKKVAAKKQDGLTTRQQNFCRAYVENGGNASDAYRRSYNAAKQKPTTTTRHAHELLKNANVTAMIATLQDKVAKRHDITMDKIISELAKIGFADIRNAVQWGNAVVIYDDNGNAVAANGVALKSSSEISDDTAAAISEVSQGRDGSLKIKFHDKRAALVDIGKHIGMFVERKEVGRPGEFAALEELSDAELADIVQGRRGGRTAASQDGATQPDRLH